MALIHASSETVLVGTDEHGDIVITPVGELDVLFAPTLLATIREAIARAPRRIVLDLGSLTFLDSAGCNVLAMTCREGRAAGVRIALCDGMPRHVRLVLAVTGLLPIFDAVLNVEQ
jgi:anti-anti-sigma factor